MKISSSSRTPVPIFPFLFAAYPALALFSHNVSQTPVSDVLRAFLLPLGFVLVMMALLGLLLRDWHKAGLVSCLLVLLFFSFGHVYQLLRPVVFAGVWLGRADVLAAVWAAGWILGTWWIIRVLRKPANFTPILNLVSAFLLSLNLINIVSFVIRSGDLKVQEIPAENAAAVAPAHSNPQKTAENLPDIYYIVLDGYGRSDILREYYGVDNSGFLDFLRNSGFYVSEESHSNYNQTALTISSALNLNYLDHLMKINEQSDNREPLARLVRDSAVRRYLEAHGYQVVAFDTWYFVTQVTDADLYYPNIERLNPFEEMLLVNSAAIFWVDRLAAVERYENYLRSFENLYHVVELKQESPKFVFAHMIIPHPPFVFKENGEPGNYSGTGEGSMFSGNQADYFEGYSSQVKFANKVFARIIEHILAESERPPVIILQADHGPGGYLNWDHVENSCIRERFSILSAIYLPPGIQKIQDPRITPVNTFRLVFNNVFGENLPLLEQKAYFSSVDRPFQFTDVTSRLDETCSLENGPAMSK